MNDKPDNILPDIDYTDISWNSFIENSVLEIAEKSKGYKIMHLQQARKMTRLYSRLMFAGITLGPLAGLLTAVGTMLQPEVAKQHIIFSISVTFISFLSGIAVQFARNGKYEEKSSLHKIASSKYKSLETNVKRQLVLSSRYRINAVKYLEYIGCNFDDTFTTSPLISKSIFNAYVVAASSSGINIPDEYGLSEKPYIRYCSPSTPKVNLTITDKPNLINLKRESKSLFNISNSERKSNFINVNNYERKSNESLDKGFSTDIKKDFTVIHIKDDNVEITTDLDSKSPLESLKSLSPKSKKIKKIKKSKVDRILHLSELNRFSDGRMEYEIERMRGI